jgi:hydrogenase maturation protease
VGKSSAALVVCIGNELVADDAVGHEVYQRLTAMELPEGTRIEYTGVGGVSLLDRLTGEEELLIVVDAVQFGAPAGTIHCIPWDHIPSCGNSAISAHGIGLRETMQVGQLLYPEKLPREILLIGIEGRCFNRMKEFMTPETARAVDKAVAACLEQITQLQ